MGVGERLELVKNVRSFCMSYILIFPGFRVPTYIKFSGFTAIFLTICRLARLFVNLHTSEE